MLHRLAGQVIAREIPVLAECGVQMWDYVVLSRLGDGPAPTQAQLAATTGRDKTRLIPILDRLEQQQLITRVPDPADRRNRVIALNDRGRAKLKECRRAIRALENQLLSGLAPADRTFFLQALQTLDAAPPTDSAPG
jgi:DNA-binding MarR family transcriptional regulator